MGSVALVALETSRTCTLAAPVSHHLAADAMQTASEPAEVRPQSASPSPEADQSRFRRRASKLGLLSIFHRSKPATDVETLEENLESHWQGIVAGEGAPEKHGQTASVPSDSDPEANQNLSLRSHSSKGTLQNKSSFKRDSKVSATWTPPPLFQAYPQAIKHATLRTPPLPAETILRHKKERNGRGTPYEESGRTTFWEGVTDDKSEQREKRPKKSSTETTSLSAWVDKIYILVTAGYLLQYTGTGAIDRLPEKILPLSQCSAAFASDAIIGKHFVLQVSQVSSADGTIDTDLSRSILKKSGLRSESKKAASSLLLVLDNADEMNEWLVVVRREIESLSGLEYRPESGPDEEQHDAPPSFRMAPSHRYPVRGDPNKSSEKAAEPLLDLDFGDLSIDKANDADGVPEPEQSSADGKSHIAPHSIGSRYISNTQASIDQVHLDRLRESYASTTEGTTSTSRDSSPDRALSRIQTETGPDSRRKVSEAHLSISEASPGLIQEFSYIYSANRDSLQQTPTSSSRPTSVLPASPNKASSPPNFSVPTFSKRFSGASASAATSSKTQTSPPGSSSGHLSPPMDKLAREGAENSGRNSTVGEMYLNPNSNSSMAKRFSSPQSSSRLGTPPTSSHSHKSWTDAERQFSRRLSSLEYGRGISPIKASSHAPPPHPPPNVPLPPIPGGESLSKRNSSIPPPTAPPTGPLPPLPAPIISTVLPPVPSSTLPTPPQSGQRPASTSSDVALPLQKPSPPISSVASPAPETHHLSLPSAPSLAPSDPDALSSPNGPPSSAASAKHPSEKPRGLRRPGSSQQQPGYSSGPSPEDLNVHHQYTLDQQVASMGLASPSSGIDLPAQPTREAPAPPLEPVQAASQAQPRPATPPQLHKHHKSSPRLGREPPPVSSSPRKLSKTKPSTTASSRSSSSLLRGGSLENTRPPSFIPPIQVSSSRKSRSSFDGPWNTGYEGSTKMGLDLGTR